MPASFQTRSRRISCQALLSRLALAAFLAAGISGCASNKSYVVLLKNDDGHLGKVTVTNRNGGSTVLDQQQQATFIGNDAGKTFMVPEKQLSSDFGPALAAMPVLPVSFLLYFDYSNTKLTLESVRLIPEISDAIGKHPAPDVSIIGHTDTMGDDNYNNKLSMERARAVAALLNLQSKLGAGRLSIEAHGEKRLLILTPDNTAEARNRRVEVTVR